MPETTMPLFPELAELPAESSEEPSPVLCPCCQTAIEDGDGIECDNELHCMECVHTCEECDTVTTDDDEIQESYVARGRHALLCSSCRFECADCNEQFANSLNRLENASGNRICESCSENYYCCDDCNEVLHSDDVHGTDDGMYCAACYRSHDTDAILHEYDYKPRPTFLRADLDRDRSNMFMGIELEVDHEDSREREADIQSAGLDDCTAFYCKADGSLDEGFEIVSHPATWEYWKAKSWSFTTTLKLAGYRSYDTKTCGMHIHVSKAAVSELSRFKLLHFFRTNKKFITLLSRRRPGSLERWAAIDGNGTAALIKKVKDGPEGRYEAINLLPAKTVEFRIFRGTLDPKSIRRNIALVYALCQFVQSVGMRQLWSKDLIHWLKGEGKYIVGKEDANELIKWFSSRAPETIED